MQTGTLHNGYWGRFLSKKAIYPTHERHLRDREKALSLRLNQEEKESIRTRIRVHPSTQVFQSNHQRMGKHNTKRQTRRRKREMWGRLSYPILAGGTERSVGGTT